MKIILGNKTDSNRYRNKKHNLRQYKWKNTIIDTIENTIKQMPKIKMLLILKRGEKM